MFWKRDEPTTIDLHDAKPIDFTASAPDQVKEDLRQSDVVLTKRLAIFTGCVGAFYLLTFAVYAHQLRTHIRTAPDFVVVRAATGTIFVVVTFVISVRRWRRLKSQDPRR